MANSDQISSMSGFIERSISSVFGNGKQREERCQDMVDKAIHTNTWISFLLKSLEDAGCVLDRSLIFCEKCDLAACGGVVPGKGIVVCMNNVDSQDSVNQVLIHELIHAYDECRAKDLNWYNLEHHACSEIRAANLSGDCHLLREFARGNLQLLGGHEVCVRRRAQLSVAMNPSCESSDDAKNAINRVWDICYSDTKPFYEVP